MRTFGHQRPIRDKDRNIIGQKESPVRAVTVKPLGGMFGKDKKRRLVVKLATGDTILLKPHGTRREVSVLAVDVYRFAIECIANKVHMARMRERKSSIAARRERNKLASQERRFNAKVREENREG